MKRSFATHVAGPISCAFGLLALAVAGDEASATPGPPPCGAGLAVQLLGTGGPELQGGRAASSYLVRVDGRARALIDVGSGAVLRLGEAGATVDDLELVVVSHFHTDHAGDLPALLKSAQFVGRSRPLALVGPAAGGAFPGLRAFLEAQLGRSGAWPYLRGHLDGTDGRARLEAREIDAGRSTPVVLPESAGLRVVAQGVPHGPVPALAVRVEHGGRAVVFAGDQNGDDPAFLELARGADILIVHHAIADDADAIASKLHARPDELAAMATKAGARVLVLSHLMRRSESRLEESLRAIRAGFSGRVVVGTDLACVSAAP